MPARRVPLARARDRELDANERPVLRRLSLGGCRGGPAHVPVGSRASTPNTAEMPRAAHCSGAINFPRNRRIAVHCAGGYRSSIAASLLHQYGLTNVIEMAGGLAAWEAAQLPVVSQA